MNKDNDKKNNYFIEGATENDLIGFQSYVDSLKNAIKSGSKFIGIISDFGTGKSSLIKMLEKQLVREYKIITVNLWNCENNDYDNINVHQIFLHQLIDELNIFPKNYYKNRINKNYRIFDINFKEKNKVYFIFLIICYFMIVFDKLEMINIFICNFPKILFYFLLSLLTILCILFYKPILSFSKDDTTRKIDENDTKDLYSIILHKYFQKRILKKNNPKPLIISLEEIDRYDNHNDVIKYIKEFYKFYKITKYDVIFVTSIKPASKMLKNAHKRDEVKQIKDTYEKVFDFILNLNRINILDYGEILINIINENTIKKPKEIEFPNVKNIGKWRYIYQGDRITIRDIKHRYNFALSLFESVKESGITDVDFYKCIFISYLEDDYNELYEFLIDHPVTFNEILVYFSSNKNLDSYKNKEIDNFVINDNEIKILVDAISQKLISVDYTYYFFKYPINKKSYNMHELNLYNSIVFDESSEMLKNSLSQIEEKTIIEILDKRKNITIYPNVVFDYPELLKIAYNHSSKTIYNTLYTIYDLISNFSKLKEIYYKLYKLNRRLYLEIFENYFKMKKDKILELNIDERNKLRLDLVNLFKTDSVLFDFIFQNDNTLITQEEMKIINNFGIIIKLSNYFKIDDIYVTNIIKYINYSTKTNVISFIKEMSKVHNITKEIYQKIFYSIDFKKYLLLDNQVKDIYKFSKEKLELNNKDNYLKFILKVNKYNDYLDNILIGLLDSSNKDDVIRYIKICTENNYATEQSVDFINNYDKYLKLPNILLNKMYETKHYSYYVVSKLMIEGKYYIEHDKFEILKNVYINKFVKLPNWTYSVDDEMKEYLFTNVNFYELPIDRLNIFASHIQSRDLIQAVINTNDHNFIKKYLRQIKSIDKKEEKEIFYILGKYYKEYDIDYRIRKEIVKLTNSKSLKGLLDGRKNK